MKIDAELYVGRTLGQAACNVVLNDSPPSPIMCVFVPGPVIVNDCACDLACKALVELNVENHVP